MKRILSVCIGLLLIAAFAYADAADRAPAANSPQTDLKEKAAPSSGIPTFGKGAGGPDAYGFRWIDSDEAGGPAYSWIDITGTGTALNLADDGEVTITSPFPITFYGLASADLRIGNNGGIFHNNTTGDVPITNYALPSRYYQPRAILPFSDDIDSDSGNVYWEVQGSEPNRMLIIEWYSRPHYPAVGGVTFEVIFYEGREEVLFQYADVDFGNASYNSGASATVGIQGDSTAAANWFLQYSYNTASLHDNLAIKFFTYVPQAGDLALQSIDEPSGSFIEPGLPFGPAATVSNPGTAPVTDFYVYYSVDDGSKAEVYRDSVYVTTPDTLQSSATQQYAFGDFTPAAFTEYNVTAWVVAPGDPYPSNDTLHFFFRTWDLDVGTAAIVAPTGYADPSTAVDPQATFHNYGQESADFDAYFEIYDAGAGMLYGESVFITGLASGADTTVTFPTFNLPPERQAFTTSAYTMLAYDLNNGNDSMEGSFSSLPLWYYVADIPNGGGAYTRWSYNGSCVSNGMLWLVGGRRDVSWAVLNHVGTYDPASNTWDDTKPLLPQPRVYLAAAANDQYVFALGGRDGAGTTIYANVERLESPSGSAWATMTPLPAGRVFGTAVVEGGYLYYIGGTSDAGGATPTTTFWRYDIAGDTTGGTPWDQTLAQLPAALDNHDATVYNGKIYVLGNASNNSTYIYDIAGSSWNTVTNTGKPVQEMYEAVTAFNQIWTIGGNDGAASVNSVYVFDPAAETWSAGTAMQQTRMSFGAGTIGDLVVSAGGVAWPGFTPTMTTEAIDISYLGVSGEPANRPSAGYLSLMPNFPNPVSGRTSFSFTLPRAQDYSLKVYNISGQLVQSFAGKGQAGANSVNWNAQKAGAGVYFFQLNAGGQSATRKLVVVK